MRSASAIGLIGLLLMAVFALPAHAAFVHRVAVAGGGVGGSILGALLCGYLASLKNRNPWGWALFGFFCCPVAIIIVLLAGPGDYR